MDNIVEPNESFDFSKLSLAHPSSIQGGAYFTKLLYGGKPLYIQTTKSLVRQGFVKFGKKQHYCDLMFDNSSETLINWFEHLEEKCQSLLFDKSESWFQNTLEKNDIDNAFTNLIRVYKSGKYYLIRSYVKNTATNEPSVKIYNENSVSMTVADIKTNTSVISILEIQGIKFTPRNFHVEIELKQLMIIDSEQIFNDCLIKTDKTIIYPQPTPPLPHSSTSPLLQTSSESLETNLNIDEPIQNKHDVASSPSALEEDTNLKDDYKDKEKEKEKDNDKDKDKDKDNDNDNDNYNYDDNEDDVDDNYKADDSEESIKLDFEDLNIENTSELSEVVVNVNSADSLETITLKKPNEVYYDLYRKARIKAKQAKQNAIMAYLEAKKIKKSHMLDILNDSDSEFDAEIEETSESELDGF